MNIDNGQIVDEFLLSMMAPRQRERHIPMVVSPTRRQQREGRVRRSDPCPCGSGLKMKACCGSTAAVTPDEGLKRVKCPACGIPVWMRVYETIRCRCRKLIRFDPTMSKEK